MTALRYNKPMKQGLRKAGGLFGLNLLDLFSDDESKRGDFEPALTFQTTTKGRGSGLTYRPQQQNPVTTRLQLLARDEEAAAPSAIFNNTINNQNIQGEAPAAQTPAPTTPAPTTPDPQTPEPPSDTRQNLFDLSRQYGQTALFGAQDYIKAKEAGYSREEIQSFLDDNPMMLALQNRKGRGGESLYDQISENRVDTSAATSREYADKMMAFDPSAQTGEFPATQAFKDAFQYEAPQISTRFGQDAKYFGGEDYKAAKQSGFSDADIKDFLNQNLDLLRGPNTPGGSSEIGQLMKPAEEPRMAPVGSTPADPGPKPTEYQISTAAKNPEIEGSENFFGGLDYEAAKAAGKTDREVLDFLNQNLGTLRAGNVPGGGGLYDQIAARVNA
tara:strand:- start:11983 stop:13143 length:1161 start_codon:yes stop_codon:yes gene_type:complete